MESFVKEKYIEDYHQPISLQSSEKIIEQMKNCVFKINLLNGTKGTGFFCKIPYNNNILKLLITNNHIIDENILNRNEKILISINNNKDKEIILEDRKYYTNKEYDITIIEIKEKDGINHYLEIDEDIIKNKSNISYIKQTIYTIQYESDKKEASVSYGIIKGMEEKHNYTFEHLCSTFNGSSGSPILNTKTNKLIGIHKEALIKKNVNRGTFLNYALNDFIIQMNNNFTSLSSSLKAIKNNQYDNSINQYNIYNDQYILPNMQLNNPNSQFNNYKIQNNPNANFMPFPSTNSASKSPQNQKYFFPEKGLHNLGSTSYMNANLQCLLHVCELLAYFLNEYPNDAVNLRKKNKDVESQGNISKAFYDLVKGVINKSTSQIAFSPDNFKKILGYYNSQFRNFENNDSKDFFLYLLQTIHKELNYYGDVVLSPNMNLQPNMYNRAETFLYFNNTYNMINFSIISTIFYGTNEIITICEECKNYLYDFQKLKYISFNLSDYHLKEFNIYRGFKDNQREVELKGDNQFYCKICRKMCNGNQTCKIIQPPNKLLIFLEYGKNKKYQPKKIDFGEIINITEFVNFNFGCPITYRIIGVCTHLGISESFGHYIAYCMHRESGQWYNFNDSSCTKCGWSEIHGSKPYLLIYERE